MPSFALDFFASDVEYRRRLSLWMYVKPEADAGYALTIRSRPLVGEKLQRLEPNWKVGAGDPNKLISDGTYLYWENGSKAIGRVAIGGGALEPEWLVLERQFSEGAGFAIVGSQLYFIVEGGIEVEEEEEDYIASVNLSGAGLDETLIPAGNAAGGLCADATHLYWGWQRRIGKGQIGRATVTAEGAVTATEDHWFELPTARNPRWFSYDGTRVLFFTDFISGVDAVSAITPAGAYTERFIPAAGELPQQVVSAEGTYGWVGRASTEARRDVEGFEVEWFPLHGTSGGGLLVVGEYVYWTSREDEGGIGRARISELHTEPGKTAWELVLLKRLAGENVLAGFALPGDLAEGWHTAEVTIEPDGEMTVRLDGETAITSSNAVLRGGYVGFDGSPAGGLSARNLTAEGTIVSALESEEDPFADPGFAELPWDSDEGQTTGATGWVPTSEASGAYSTAEWYGEPEPEPEPPEEPEGEEVPIEIAPSVGPVSEAVVHYR